VATCTLGPDVTGDALEAGRQAFEKRTWVDAYELLTAAIESAFVPDIGEPNARAVVAAAALEEGDRVLDVACGTGIAARLAAEKVGQTGAVAAIDVNPAMLDVARTTGAQGPTIEWHQGAAENLPFDDEAFDAVVCSLGFQFFADKPAVLSGMRRVLSGGGRLSLSTVGPVPPLFEAIEAVLADHMGPEASKFIDTVFSVFDPDHVRSALDRAGFAGIEVDYRPIQLRVAPAADFVWQYVTSTPLAAIAAELDEDGRIALEQAVAERCEPFTDRGSLVMAPNVLVATGRRH
jgi:SAM-dependent methyltransferase